MKKRLFPRLFQGRPSGRCAAALALSLLLVVCSACGKTGGSSAALEVSSTPLQIPAAVTALAAAYQTGSPVSAATTVITLSGTGATADGPGVEISGSTVTIQAAGIYAVSGTLNGQLRVEAADAKVEILLNGASITCDTGAPIYSKKSQLTVMTLIEGTENSLSQGSGASYEDAEAEEPNGCLFAKNDLVICGSGSLAVNTAFRHGISTKDYLIITGGALTVTAADNGLHGHDGVYITGGTAAVTAGGDAIKANNDANDMGWIQIDGGTLTLTAQDDGIQAESSLSITGGTISVTAGGGSANATAHAGQAGGQFGGGQRPDAQTGATAQSGGTPPSTGQDGSTGQVGGAGQGSTPPTTDNAGQSGSTPPAASGSDSQSSDDTDTSDDVSGKGCKSGGALVITGGDITVDATDDAIHSNSDITISGGTLSLSAGDDGVHADSLLTVSGGSITVSTSYEGLEGASILVSGGTHQITASDDGLNASGSGSTGTDPMAADTTAQLVISGGTLKISAQGDGIDSNGTLSFTGGITLVDGPTDSGNGALDYGSDCTISGGVLVAAGSTGMATAPGSSSTQCSFLVTLSAQQTGGTPVSLVASDGTCLLTYVPQKAYQSVVFSCPGLQVGETYSIVTGGTPSENGDLGYTTSGVTGGTTDTTVTPSAISSGGAGGGQGGQQPGSGFPGGQGGGTPPENGQRPNRGSTSDGTQMPTQPSGSVEGSDSAGL